MHSRRDFYFDGMTDFYFDGAENRSAWAHSAHILPLVHGRR